MMGRPAFAPAALFRGHARFPQSLGIAAPHSSRVEDDMFRLFVAIDLPRIPMSPASAMGQTPPPIDSCSNGASAGR